jgi:hypothetical protein
MKRVLLGLIIAAGAAGCGGDATGAGREPDEYTGCGTDETWRTFSDQEPVGTKDDTQAPVVTAPAKGTTVSAAAVLLMTWQQDPNDPGALDGDVPTDPNSCPEFNRGAIMPMHLPPISGNAYDLQFTVDGTVAWRVITTLQQWQPAQATLDGWKGKTVSLQMWRMSVLRNDVKAGPFTTTEPFTFSVGP